jgi:hypothetical protein
MLPYSQDELNSLWLRLAEKGSNIDANDSENTQPLANLPAAITNDTDTEQQMIFDTSAGEVTAYTDFDAPSDPIPTVVCSRTRKTPTEPWSNWTGFFASGA